MPAVRLSFLVALCVAALHGIVLLPSAANPAVGLRNLLLWETLTALTAALVASAAWLVLRRHRLSLAIAPTLVVALEASAWLVAGNYHHTLTPGPKLAAFAAAWLVPLAIFGLVARAEPVLRWVGPVQIALALGGLGMWGATRAPHADPAGRPDLALFVLDAVQVRALGHMGAPLDPSPRIDALAAEGWTAEGGFSSAATSVPGHAAILFGLDVAGHTAPTNSHDLPDSLPAPLAERLSERGYTTMGFCHNPLVSRDAGFARGFDTWWNWGEHSWLDAPPAVALLHWPAVYLWRRASDEDFVTYSARVALHGARGPLFTFVQLLYTHDSYVDGDGWVGPERIDHLEQLLDRGELSNRTSYGNREIAELYASYLASIAYSDRLVGELVQRLEERAGARGLVVAITADHGENLAEHGDDAVARHFGPWSTSLRIPIVVADSRVRTGGVRSRRLTSHQRILRLFLDAADGRLPREPEGWARAVGVDLALEPAFIYSEPWLVLVDDSLKVAIDRSDLASPPVVHRWREDFEDQVPISDPEVVRPLWEQLLAIHERMRERGVFDAPPDPDPEKLEHLRALGYVE